jgi:hypothetical protein
MMFCRLKKEKKMAVDEYGGIEDRQSQAMKRLIGLNIEIKNSFKQLQFLG